MIPAKTPPLPPSWPKNPISASSSRLSGPPKEAICRTLRSLTIRTHSSLKSPPPTRAPSWSWNRAPPSLCPGSTRFPRSRRLVCRKQRRRRGRQHYLRRRESLCETSDDLSSQQSRSASSESRFIPPKEAQGHAAVRKSGEAKPTFAVTYDEGLKVGYKWYDAENKPVLFLSFRLRSFLHYLRLLRFEGESRQGNDCDFHGEKHRFPRGR